MATEATLRSQRFRKLMAEHGQGLEVRTRACVGLAWAIERGDEREIRDLVQQHTQPLRQAAVDVVVLGCTHYPFVRTLIQEAMGPQVQLLDTAEPVARQAARLLEPRMPTLGGALSREPGGVRFWTSGQPEKLEDFARRWLGWTIRAEPLPEPAGALATAAAGPR